MSLSWSSLRRLTLPLLILAVAVGGFALLVATKPQTHHLKPQEKAWPVAVMEVSPGRLPRTLVLYGRVDTLARSTLASALAADVVEVKVIEGQAVEAGQLLVRLDDRDYRLDLAQRQAELDQVKALIEAENSAHRANLEALPRERRLLELARAEVDRLKDLKGRKLSSQADLDRARQGLARQAIAVSRIEEKVRGHTSRLRELQARLAQRQAALEKARLQLERTRIAAPYAGRVVSVAVAAGQRVRPGAALVTLFDRDSLVLRAQVPDPHLPELRRLLAAGERPQATAEVDGGPVTARLEGFTAAVPQGAGSVEALFRVTAGGGRLQLGRVAALTVSLPPVDEAVAIPFEALYGADKVWLVNDEQRLQPVRVERLGELRQGGRTRLLVRAPQLVAGARLLITQLPNAVEGLLVKVVGGG